MRSQLEAESTEYNQRLRAQADSYIREELIKKEKDLRRSMVNVYGSLKGADNSSTARVKKQRDKSIESELKVLKSEVQRLKTENVQLKQNLNDKNKVIHYCKTKENSDDI